MRILHLEARSEKDILPVVRKALGSMKKNVAMVSTIQHLHKLEEAKGFLEDNGIKAGIAGQVLGCSVPEIPKTAEQVLYIGSGSFHPVGILLKANKEVITANPFSGRVSKVTEKDVQALEKRKKGALARFLSSECIGVLVSTKPGQTNIQGGMKKVNEIKKKHDKKSFYVFDFDTLQKGYLEDFPFIECWINTACPRIFEDFEKGMINLEDVPD